ncbi:AMP-binding protein [Porticoccus hydrocarbonoclasticus]|uniref:AMP-binding protein n=1 Tax=Porticoccus hydrocarbonoclasticus TaxID=1073414 RepID=UPI0023556639|nr:AMP-binding protein [Porticoccus hydrocarbonoclasticus]
MRLVDFLDQSPALFSEKAKFVDLDNDLSLSYRQMVDASIKIATLLKEQGVKRQDIVATYAPNSVAAYCCIFAISRVGAVWLPLNMRNTFEANRKLIEKSGAVKLFVDDSVATAFPELSDTFPGDQLIELNGQRVADIDLRALSGQALVVDSQSDVDDGAGLVNLFATGGTTGDSKLAEWGSITWDTLSAIQNELMPLPDIPACYLVAAPMTHAAGIASFEVIRQGANVVVMEGMVPERLLATIETHRVTHLFMPPTAIYMLLAHPRVKAWDYSSLRYFWYAAAPMSVEKLKEAIDVFGPVMVQTYGQAEAPMLCTFLSAEDHVLALDGNNPSILRSCGKTSPHVEVAVMDDEGNLLEPGQEGEIAIRGNLLMRAYYRNPEATEAIRCEGGWQRSGDIGVFDEQGYLAIVDRKRDMIISGGFNVYPSEIEQLLWGHSAIKDCAVIGIPDEKWGEQVTAVVELKDKSQSPDEQEIIQYCKSKLGSVKAPKQVLFWDELPRSPVGKVLKKEIRKVFWEAAGRKI